MELYLKLEEEFQELQLIIIKQKKKNTKQNIKLVEGLNGNSEIKFWNKSNKYKRKYF